MTINKSPIAVNAVRIFANSLFSLASMEFATQIPNDINDKTPISVSSENMFSSIIVFVL